jgi:hypothetical protein
LDVIDPADAHAARLPRPALAAIASKVCRQTVSAG